MTKLTFSVLLFLLSMSALTFGSCSNRSVLEAREASQPEVEKALKLIDEAPQSPAGYIQLSSAYIRICRETGNIDYNIKADAAIDRALELDAKSIPARKLKATLMLSFHRFADGLKLAEQLRSEIPEDAFVYGLLVDAHDELGNYDAAVESAQKMVDLKPNASAYSRIGHIRSLHGDTDGAIEAFKLAARMTDPVDREGRSWCLVQIGNEHWRTGRYDDATRVYDEALSIFPDYHLALAGKGRALASSGDLENAVPLLTAAQAKHLNLDTIFLLGDVYEKLGERDKADDQYALGQGGEATLGMANDPHRVALFWANRGENLQHALEIAQADYANQKDIYASDTLAWCLYRLGRYDEAKSFVTEAMRIDTPDSKILFHAGMIEKALGDTTKAERYLDRALEVNPGFDVFQAEEARAALDELRSSVASIR